MTDLIERLHIAAKIHKDIGGQSALAATIREAVTALEAAREPCVWTQDEEFGYWHTGCDNAFEIIDGTPADNSMVFCCYCGCPIAAIDAARKEVGDEWREALRARRLRGTVRYPGG